MITKLYLEVLKKKEFQDIQINNLVDINLVHIDTQKPVFERIISFIENIGNPYLFRCGDTPVRVSFATNGLSLQECFEKMIETEFIY